MKTKKAFISTLILLTVNLFTTSSAHAIPPPEAIMSIWQSALQMLGVLSVFLVGAYYSMRQFFSQWKRPILVLSLIATVSLIGIGFYSGVFQSTVHASQNNQVKNSSKNTTTNNIPEDVPLSEPHSTPNVEPLKSPLIQGEILSVEDTIKREKDDYTRKWKMKTIVEMKHDLAALRKQQKRTPISFKTIASFTPKALHKNIQTKRDQLYILDVREAYERSKFNIPFDNSIRFGDLANDNISAKLRQALPKNKRIVVLCHSGLRGYLAANLLDHLGYQNVSFLQGGLANWHDEKLAMNGSIDFFTNISNYPLYAKHSAIKDKGLFKVQIDVDGKVLKGIKNLHQLPFENADSNAINTILKQSKGQPVLLICQTYGGCYHTVNFGYTIEQAGGKVAGVYDATGEFLVAPIIQ